MPSCTIVDYFSISWAKAKNTECNTRKHADWGSHWGSHHHTWASAFTTSDVPWYVGGVKGDDRAPYFASSASCTGFRSPLASYWLPLASTGFVTGFEAGAQLAKLVKVVPVSPLVLPPRPPSTHVL